MHGIIREFSNELSGHETEVQEMFLYTDRNQMQLRGGVRIMFYFLHYHIGAICSLFISLK